MKAEVECVRSRMLTNVSAHTQLGSEHTIAAATSGVHRQIQIQAALARELSEADIARCAKLTLLGGSMRDQFLGGLSGDDKSKVVLARHRGLIIGWALIFRQTRPQAHWQAYFYVLPRWRRRGIGAALAQEVRCRTRGVVQIFPSGRTVPFFAACDHKRFIRLESVGLANRLHSQA